MLVNLDDQERNTILAALRYYQEQGMGEPDNRSNEIHDLATNGDTEVSMDDEGIDALCEKINPPQSDDALFSEAVSLSRIAAKDLQP